MRLHCPVIVEQRWAVGAGLHTCVYMFVCVTKCEYGIVCVCVFWFACVYTCACLVYVCVSKCKCEIVCTCV